MVVSTRTSEEIKKDSIGLGSLDGGVSDADIDVDVTLKIS